jgi:hypothetical protein
MREKQLIGSATDRFATLPPSPGIPPVRFRIGAMQGVHVYSEINDLERGVAFYVNELGLRVLRRLTPRSSVPWTTSVGALTAPSRSYAS